MTELKPCPFCGGKADWFVLEKMNNEKLYYVECSYCFARTGYYFTEYESIKEWNKRTPDWISVKDRLPEEECHGLSKRVLVTDGEDVNIEWYDYHLKVWDCEEYSPVTDEKFWMPLPEPPEGE